MLFDYIKSKFNPLDNFKDCDIRGLHKEYPHIPTKYLIQVIKENYEYNRLHRHLLLYSIYNWCLLTYFCWIIGTALEYTKDAVLIYFAAASFTIVCIAITIIFQITYAWIYLSVVKYE